MWVWIGKLETWADMNRVLNLGFCNKDEVNVKSDVDELMSSGL